MSKRAKCATVVATASSALSHVTHVRREDEDLCSGMFAKDHVSGRIELCLGAGPGHQHDIGAGEGVLQRDLGTNAARCAGDEHRLAWSTALPAKVCASSWTLGSIIG
jgi:hypothetical protein